MFVRFTAVLSACALSGCVQYTEITTPPLPVAYSNAAVSQAVTGTRPTEIRTLQVTGDQETEIAGARCDLQGTGFATQVTSPAIVLMPTFKGSADPVRVTCAANGQTVATVAAPRNETVARLNQPTPTTGGLIGAIATSVAIGVIAASRDPLQDDYAYDSRIISRFGQVQ